MELWLVPRRHVRFPQHDRPVDLFSVGYAAEECQGGLLRYLLYHCM